MSVVLLDGGMGQELVARSRHPLHPLWSTQVLALEPELVEAVHLDYLRAGARVLTVNAYTLTPTRLARAGIADRLEELAGRACALADAARRAFAEERAAEGRAPEAVAIAGCLPPLVASYRPDLTPPRAEATAQYARMVAAQAPHVDLFLAETMSSALEARAAAEAAAASGKPVWVAWTLRDGGAATLRSGEKLEAAAAALADLPVSARLVNCCHPESVAAALPGLVALGGAVGAYANAFQSIEALKPGGTVAALSARDDLGPDAYAAQALSWVDAGARLIGGCCEVGPAHIAEIARRLRARGLTPTARLAA